MLHGGRQNGGWVNYLSGSWAHEAGAVACAYRPINTQTTHASKGTKKTVMRDGPEYPDNYC